MEKTLEQIADELVRTWQDNIIQNGQEASGKTREALHYELKPDGNGFYIKGLPHTGTLEEGRAPGKTPANFPDILIQWANHKGLVFDNPAAALRWAKRTAYFIHKFGTRLYRMGGNQGGDSGKGSGTLQPAIERMQEQLKQYIIQAYTVEVKRTLYRSDYDNHN